MSKTVADSTPTKRPRKRRRENSRGTQCLTERPLSARGRTDTCHFDLCATQSSRSCRSCVFDLFLLERISRRTDLGMRAEYHDHLVASCERHLLRCCVMRIVRLNNRLNSARRPDHARSCKTWMVRGPSVCADARAQGPEFTLPSLTDQFGRIYHTDTC